MAAISKDFVVKNGIVIEGDSAVTSSTNQVDALQVDGGAAIAKNLIVGTTATILGNVFFNQPLLPLSRDATLGSPDNPFSELYLRGNSLYIDHVVITSTGTDLTVSSTLGSSVVHAGSLILSNIASSNSPTTGALQVAGGAGISGNLYVGSDAELQQTLSVTGTSMFYSTISVEGIASFNNSTLATSSGNGAVEVTGGVRINNNLVVMSTASNTGTLETNAIYVEGGVGIKGGLAVSGNAVFKNDVYFQGATTYVYSTNTVYTDNLIELHVPPTGSWVFDDGKDVGLRFHYYNNGDWNAALVIANDSKKLEFYKNGSEVNGAFVGVYGDFKTGTLQLVNTATSISTTTGALTVAGGVGIAGNLVVAGGISGTITRAINLTGGVKGSIPIQSSTGTTTFIAPGTGSTQVLKWDPATSTAIWGENTSAGIANTTSNISGGYPGAIVYQFNTGITTFLIGSSAEYMLTYNTGTHAPQWTNPNEYTVGYANTATTSTWASTASYAIYAANADFATTASQTNYALFADSATTATTSTYAFTSTYAKIASTSTYADITFTSTYADIAFTSTYATTSNYAIVASTSTYANIAFTSTYANTSNYALVAGTSTYADIAFTASWANTSNYAIVAGTSTYADIAFTASWANTSNYAIVAGTSTYANIAFTSTYANTSNYALVAGTSTYASTANYAFTSTWADTSTNISGGASGSILYQSTTGVTVSLPLGNVGYILSADSTAPKWISTDGLTASYANTATTAYNANNIRTHYQSASLTYYPTFVANNNALDNYEPLYTTSSFGINPRTGAVNIGGKVTFGGQLWASTGSSIQVLSTSSFSIVRNIDPSPGAEVFTSLPTGTVWLQQVYTANDKIWLTNDRKAQSSRYVNFDSFGALNFGDSFVSDQEYVSLHPDPDANAFQINITSFANFPNFTTSTWVFDAVGNLTAPGKIIVNSTATSTSTTTGALTVAGGAGIGGDMYVGGDIYSRSYKVITTATINQYTSTATYANTSNYAIVAGTSTYAFTATYANTSNYAIVAGTSTWASTSTNISGGGIGSLIYQLGAGQTTSLPLGNLGEVLVVDTNTPKWVALSGLTAGSATTATTSTYAFTATYANTSNYAIVAGTSTYANTSNYAIVAGTSTYANTSNYAIVAGTSTYANTSNYAIIAGTSTYASTASYAIEAGTSTYANTSNYAIIAGTSTYASTASYAINAGTSTYANTSTNVSGGLAGQLVYQSSTGSTSFVSTGTAGNVLVSNGSSVPTYNNTLTLAGTNSATSTITGALQVVGGVGIGGDIYAGGDIYTKNQKVITTATINSYANQTTITAGTDTAVNTATGNITIWNNSTLQSVTNRGNSTTNAVSILNTASSTGTLQANALYVAGGIGAGSLFIQGPSVFNSSVVFNGTSTSVLTTNTIYTDNILELHFPNNTSSQWLVNDGLDIGYRFHYYDTQDCNAFLGRNNATGYLEWLVNSSADNVPNITGTNGTFRLGSIILTDTTASSSTSTGALTVAGGVGIGGALYVGTTSYIAGSQILTTATVNQYATQTTIFAGTDTAVNTSTGAVTVWNTSTLQSVTSRGATTDVAVSITNSTASSSTSTGALTVAGGVGINKGLYVGGNVTATTFFGNLTGVATTATNIANGAAGSLPYQSATGTTAFLSIGTNGTILTSNGTSPTWTAISGLSAGQATTATNLANGTAGQVPYQIAAGSTSFYGPGTAGQILLSSGTNAPVYTNTSSVYVGKAVLADTATLASNATTATNLAGGTQGQVPYQTAGGSTSFYGPGTAGNVLVSNGTGAPTYNSTLTLASTITSISTTTGALKVSGGVGVADSIYVGNRVGFVNTGNVSTVYQYYNAATNSLDTVFG